MNNKTTVDTLEIARFSQLAGHWWDKNGPLKTLHDINPVRLDFIEQYVKLEQKSVLDVGCGGGILSEAMAQKHAVVHGIDAEAESIETARTHAQKNNLSVTYSCVPIEDFTAPAFDVITCMEMLEHVLQPGVVVNHCARLLQSGGYLFLSTINRTPRAYAEAVIAAEYLLGLLPRQTHDYHKFIKPSELAAMSRNAGLEVIGLQGIHYNPFTRLAGLKESVHVNYLMACRKP
ncbi:bifunctional 2-polyprenyl-6-hydroxyphenol methylase/3-demethylubiquinol 3-O-methyltransferase UbiG [Legionella spiritensis]|uniref:Ubiquinone biosynthesis O-methyltransferase n=1 Tax=Legionella spiritensis TaxID=452 RepID=A0A0W0Z757_LEGSP|nr:bifunctional 2-polyprenyl-6-hydroxyphenol methylase/3-demethylubiquinol 3-O-methyltransferase UbiG [Legionella spiritensis]KTD64767.1 3-demethylubiquinone-9 3-methyltransferase [Legionella spiritensis]SNV39737.1 3-demethylubiquinone-9 3-methyltransferase [Legionella spiritensis]